MSPCSHKQQFVAPLFKGLMGQHCSRCGYLIDAWQESTGDSVSAERLVALKKLTGPKFEEN